MASTAAGTTTMAINLLRYLLLVTSAGGVALTILLT